MPKIRFVPFAILVACSGDSSLTTQNNEPVAEITTPSNGATVDEGYTVSLRGVVSDADSPASELEASWYSGTRDLCIGAPISDDGTTTCDFIAAFGDTEIVLEARDPKNAAGTDTLSLIIAETGAPTAVIQRPTGLGTYYSDVAIDVSATVADAEDAPGALTVAWSDGNGATLTVDTTPDETGLLEGSILLPVGETLLTLSVLDTSGKSAETGVLISVGAPNNAPTCAITAPADESIGAAGSPLVLEALLGDVDVDPTLLTASWSSDLDGDLGTSSVKADGTTSFSFAPTFGTHEITMLGTDDGGATCVASVTYSAGSAPTLVIESPTDGEIYNEGETISFVAMVSDDVTAPEAIALVWESDVDGVLNFDPADAGGLSTFDESNLTVGDHVVTLLATDEYGLFSEADVSFSVNGLPSEPGISITPADPATTDELVAAVIADSFDPEGDTVSYAWAWTVNGISTAYSTAAVPASATTKGEVWAVFVTPNDGRGDGVSGTASVVIANSLPVLSAAVLSPDPAAEGDTLTCAAGAASDADGDTVSASFGWEVNGAAIAATGETLGDTWFSQGDAVACIVTPNDGDADGPAVTSNVVNVGNTVPSIASVAISPNPAGVSDTLSCATSGWFDADGDAEQTTFAWVVSGVAVATTPTLSGAFAGGDVVMCTATPFDGYDAGTSLSASLTITNSPPVLADVSLVPAAPTETDLLTCMPGATTDADGTSAFTYAYSWTVDGGVIAATGPTLDGADFDKGESVRCRVVPNDGTDDGVMVASNAADVENTAPVVSAVSISPSSPGTIDVVSATVSASDADGDAVSSTFEWFVNGASVAVGSTLSGDGFFDVDDKIYVVATPFDGDDAGLPVASAEVTVTNSAPTIASAEISPNPAYVDSTLSCATIGFSDADADADQSTMA